MNFLMNVNYKPKSVIRMPLQYVHVNTIGSVRKTVKLTCTKYEHQNFIILSIEII